ncbi:5-formyltetrahydrofolate cyclo-ligase [Tissierella praeacuta]|uniref:5-formyltetrahydrofolate cyclo-ligase n=1 Tax=Tissierella praeacuta DSM 18095 TaxID=1123404 RepID=A0A1M4V769_9FIRM|nr:5-formyltetrahydrofolate cyclo-ligase [Tissierella praeacuta]MBU5255038.1 5-formyltetrahydrofolate cyclo-ligase [Tissierella praeacuta]SHE64804.1 5-formyltetrahydrofolate cyclo-ligase [Tissierella praeacuta DSM 18095]SUP02976.1 5-formyltetrahydrofolate cyclo-ligase family protein [Tissierella praeacuta]
MDKKILRKKILQKRAELSTENIVNYSNIIENKLYKMDYYKNAKTIMSFISFGDEIITHEIIKNSIKNGKSVVVPITIPETKELKVSKILDFSELEIGYYNILTPKKDFLRFIDFNTIDLVLVPGVVFARDGYRVGYGGGYYDRFLSKFKEKVNTIGLAFDLQIVEEVPKDSFDIPVDFIITEKETINCLEK